MRLFVAISLEDHVHSALEAVAERVRNALAGAAPGADRAIRWVRGDHVHLTLHFLGEVDGDRADALARRLEESSNVAGFELGIGGLACLPDTGPPRVITVGLSRGRTEVAALRLELGDRLRDLGCVGEARAFRPHLTLGRVKRPLPPDARLLIARVAPGPRVTCRVGTATLYRSEPGRDGPVYTALAHTPLARS
jgi:2'-5' RNA ligase